MEGSLNPEAIVIGGGLAGLTAAALLFRGEKAALMEYVVARQLTSPVVKS